MSEAIQNLLNVLDSKVATLEEKVVALKSLSNTLGDTAVALAVRVIELERQVASLETGVEMPPDPDALGKLLTEAGASMLSETGGTLPLEG